MPPATHFLFVGCGKMGGALLEHTLKNTSSAPSIQVLDPSPLSDRFKSFSNVSWAASPDKLPTSFIPDLIVLAIKPQNMKEALQACPYNKRTLYLSIAAGITIKQIEALLGHNECSVVRAMPNLPASLGAGMTVAVANSHVTPFGHSLCDAFLKNVGETLWINDEKMMSAVTALSGSGPAYVFALCESMTSAGIALGLLPEISGQLARQTLFGSGLLLSKSSENATTLRQAVTSPGGTTEAAMKYLLGSDGLSQLMYRSMTAAALRADELTEIFNAQNPTQK